MDYTEVDITLNEVHPFADILVAKLHEIEFEAYTEYESGLKAYIQTKLLNKDMLKHVMMEVSKLTKLSFRIVKIKKQNWNSDWESNYSPVFINKDCVIRADFHPSNLDVKYEIIITPKMSFGTGHHETTSLVANQMFDLDINDKKVLDMGTGTGILAILASKLGAKNIVAIDFDKWAFENSQENANLNDISNIKFIHGDIGSVGNRKYDIIFANINRNHLIENLHIYVSLMQSEGIILLSGFLCEDGPLILEKTNQLGLELVISKNNNLWQMLHLKKV